MRNKLDREPTYVSKVEEVLRIMDDFVMLGDVAELAKITRAQAMSSLAHLKNYKVVDCIEAEGQLHWFYTPENDTRQKIFPEWKHEDKPRRKRAKKGIALPDLVKAAENLNDETTEAAKPIGKPE